MKTAYDYDVVVLGCGISGLVSSAILGSQDAQRIAAIDEFDHLGGNHIDVAKDGYTFDVGSLIFQDDSPLLDHFPALVDAYEEVNPSWGKLNPQGRVVKYPIDIREEVLQAGLLEWSRILASVLKARLFHTRRTNAQEFARFWIGSRLLHLTGLDHYLKRFFGIAAEEVDVAFATKRMMWIRDHATIGFWVRRIFGSKKEKTPTNRQMVRPRSGYADLYAIARRDLQAAGVEFMLGTKIDAVRKVDAIFQIRIGERVLTTPRIVSTIPLDRAGRLFGLAAEAELPTVTLISLFFSFAGKRGFDQSILYNFSYGGAWKRLTVYSDFYGKNRDREFFTVEVIAALVGNDPGKAAADFRAHTEANGLFSGDLQLEGTYTLPYAYPIHTKGAAAEAERIVAEFRALGVQSFGRQGGFDYQPTARMTTLVAREALGGTGEQAAIRPLPGSSSA